MWYRCDLGLVVNPGSVVSMPVVKSSRTFALVEDLSDAELTAGVGPLWQKIAIWRPAASDSRRRNARAARTATAAKAARPATTMRMTPRRWMRSSDMGGTLARFAS